MNASDYERMEKEKRREDGTWKIPLYLLTDNVSPEACYPFGFQPGWVAAVEIYLLRPIPFADVLRGILLVGEAGIWFHDGDVAGPPEFAFRRYLVPWRVIKGVVVHAAT